MKILGVLAVIVLILTPMVWVPAAWGQMSPDQVMSQANAAQLDALANNHYGKMTYLNGVARQMWIQQTQEINKKYPMGSVDNAKAIQELNRNYINTLNTHGNDFYKTQGWACRNQMLPDPNAKAPGVVDRLGKFLGK